MSADGNKSKKYYPACKKLSRYFYGSFTEEFHFSLFHVLSMMITLCMLGNFSNLSCHLLTFIIINIFKKNQPVDPDLGVVCKC